jgi:hypothetical protein
MRTGRTKFGVGRGKTGYAYAIRRPRLVAFVKAIWDLDIAAMKFSQSLGKNEADYVHLGLGEFSWA